MLLDALLQLLGTLAHSSYTYWLGRTTGIGLPGLFFFFPRALNPILYFKSSKISKPVTSIL